MYPTTNVFAEAHKALTTILKDHGEYVGETLHEAADETALLLADLAMDYEADNLLTDDDHALLATRSDEGLDPGAEGHDWTDEQWADWRKRKDGSV